LKRSYKPLDINGKFQACRVLGPGNYILQAFYNGSQFGDDTSLIVAEDGVEM